MPYVSRDATGNVSGVFPDAAPFATELLAASDPAVIAFQNKQQAFAMLDASDRTILRCYENGVAVPSAWANYRKALRAVVSGTSTTMPTQPPYPAGT